MTIRSKLRATDRLRFYVGAPIRYKPGFGVYGFEDVYVWRNVGR